MNPLMPSRVADIALHAYAVRRLESLGDAWKSSKGLGLGDDFTIDGGTRFEGVSGSVFFNSRSGFGYIARGAGARQNEAVVAIRGTKPFYDFLTDLNFAVDLGPSGYLVHAGFHRTFQSFREPLSECITKGKFTGVHVVGHSLGGALATLTADYLKQAGLDVKLYTFGAPRSGELLHCAFMTKMLMAENIFRVFHTADPVSMIPVYPFQHIPTTTVGYMIPCTGRIDVTMHYMDSYITSLGHSDWKGLAALGGASNMLKKPEELLSCLSSGDGVTMLSARALWLILQALEAVVQGIGATAGLAAMTGATLIDRLAQLLYSGILISATIADQVKQLLHAILKFLGHAGDRTQEVTVAFISWLLQSLFRVIANAASRALHHLE